MKLTPKTLSQIIIPHTFSLSSAGRYVVYLEGLPKMKQIYQIDLQTHTKKRLTQVPANYASPTVCDDGTIAYILEGALKTLTIDGQEKTITAHPAGQSSPTWSADGKKLAFLSRRHGFSQVYVYENETISRITTEPRDFTAPIISEDGSIYSTSLHLDLDANLLYRNGKPITDASQGRLLDPYPRQDGSVFYVADTHNFSHVYQHSALGDVTELHHDPYDYIRPFTDASGEYTYAHRYQHGNLHIVAIPSLESLFPQEDGIYRALGFTSTGDLLYTMEAPNQPLQLYVHQGDTSLALTEPPLPQSLEPLPVQRLSYRAHDAIRIEGSLYKPMGEGTFPVLVYPHGGPTHHHQHRFDAAVSLLVQEGYAVFAPDFRGSTGRGREFRLLNRGEWGHNDLSDVLMSKQILQQQTHLDPDKIGIWGGSYGGYLVLCALAFAPGHFKVGVDLFGDSEIRESYEKGDRLGRLDLQRQMGNPYENPDLYRRGSPVYAAEHVQEPLLIFHGKKDERVVPAMSERMIVALNIENKYHVAHFYEEEGHGFVQPKNLEHYYEHLLQFLDQFLRGNGEPKPKATL